MLKASRIADSDGRHGIPPMKAEELLKVMKCIEVAKE
jgi:hypothetical protein